MAEESLGLADLRREIVEARNQAIKTDNQVKNLSIDIRGFERRFDGLEGRVRLSSVGVNLIVAATIGIAAYIVGVVRSHAYAGELASLRAAVEDARGAARQSGAQARERAAGLEAAERAHAAASATAAEVLSLLDARRERDAAAMLERLDMGALTPFERQLSERRFADLRSREADATLRSGRSHAVSGRHAQAVPELERALALAPEGRTAAAAHYYLGTSHFALKHYEAAEPHLKAVAEGSDAAIAEEARYLLAVVSARGGRAADARSGLAPLAEQGGRFAPGARAYLAALAGEGEMPTDLPGSRVRVPRSRAAASAAAPEAARPAAPSGAAAPTAAADAGAAPPTAGDAPGVP